MMRCLLPAPMLLGVCLLLGACLLPASAQAAPVRIGSKQFTESVILGEPTQ